MTDKTGVSGKPACVIPQEDAPRKASPMYRGLIGYFPYALYAVAKHSFDNDRKHSGETPDGPRWARGKSTDHLDCILRHVAEVHLDPDYHLAALAWRALAALQERGESLGFAEGASSYRPDKRPHVSLEEVISDFNERGKK